MDDGYWTLQFGNEFAAVGYAKEDTSGDHAFALALALALALDDAPPLKPWVCEKYNMTDADEREYDQKGFIRKGQSWVVKCPCCDGPVEVLEINCRIFNHSKLGPHSSKSMCDAYRLANPESCAMPFYFDGAELYALVKDGMPDYTR